AAAGLDDTGFRPLRALFLGAAWGQNLGQAPVQELDLAEGAHHDVARLQIAVDHPARVRVGHDLTELLEYPQDTRQIVRGRRRWGGRAPLRLSSLLQPGCQ